jgi:hypothetical protein
VEAIQSVRPRAEQTRLEYAIITVVVTVIIHTRMYILLKQELFTLPWFIHGFNGVLVAQYLVFCVVICKSCILLLYFSFGHCIVCLSMYDFLISTRVSSKLSIKVVS